MTNEIKGRAVTDVQKRAILDRLYVAWCSMPAFRLGQLLTNVFGDRDLFYIEDDDFVTEIECDQIEWNLGLIEYGKENDDE